MRAVATIARRPAVWLAPGLFILWAWVLRSEVEPLPVHAFPTGAAESHGMTHRDPSTWVAVRDVADDGSAVTVEVLHGTFGDASGRPRLWDARTGRDCTPPAWEDPDRAELIERPHWREPGLSNLLTTAEGRAFLGNPSAWAALRERFAVGRDGAVDDVRRTVRPDERADLFPASLRFSPDGRLVAYVSRHGYPVHLVDDSLGDGTTVEDARTGRQVAFLPGLMGPVRLAPGGHVAVSRVIAEEQDEDRPRLALWDLETGTIRAGLSAAADPAARFSPDGRYVFARYSVWARPGGHYLRWWDTATGRQVGHVENAWDTAVMAGGRVLVTKPLPPKRAGVSEAYRLYFWDVATGASLGEWDLGAPADGGGLFDHLAGSDSDRYLTAVFHPDYGRSPDVGRRVADQLTGVFGDEPPLDRKQVVVWDVLARREVAHVPGRAAAPSADGRWLATIDASGMVRVWEVPPQRPWGRVLGYAAVAALACALALAAAGRLARTLGLGALAGRLARGLCERVRDRRRRWRVLAAGGLVSAALGGYVWYGLAASRARAELGTAFEEVNASHGLTEVEVTAIVGRPADPGPVAEIAGPKSGGGETGIPVTLRKWSRYGTEMDVFFGEDGTNKSVWISDPPPTLIDRIARWLGI
jgi:hypothetical protein